MKENYYENYKNTSNRRIYKYSRIDKLQLTNCPKCSPHRGCNRFMGPKISKKYTSRSWKDLTSKRKQWMP
jgi:hypothetical protein